MLNHQGTIEITTGRLLLRRCNTDDANDMFENWASDEIATRFMTWKTYKNVSDVLDYIKSVIDDYKNLETYSWFIVLKETNQLIGSISFHNINEELSSMEVGYIIGREWWGNGYVPEALSALMRFAF